MDAITRRTFVKSPLAASAAFSVLPGGRAASPNEKIIIGVMGLGGRGSYLAQAFAKRKDTEAAARPTPRKRQTTSSPASWATCTSRAFST